MKNHLPELGKSLLILVLICTLLLLTLAAMPAELLRSTPWLSSLLQPIAPLVGLPQAELAYVEDALPVTDAAQPLAVSIHSSTGRHTAQWDFEALDDAYETLGGMLGEALDTAGDFTAVRPKRLQQALSKPSVSFDYNFPLPARLLAFWLNAVPPEDAPAGSVYVLAVEDNQVNLYLRGDGCYRAATQVSPTALLALLEQFKADGSRFAFETTSHLADLALIPARTPSSPPALRLTPSTTATSKPWPRSWALTPMTIPATPTAAASPISARPIAACKSAPTARFF